MTIKVAEGAAMMRAAMEAGERWAVERARKSSSKHEIFFDNMKKLFFLVVISLFALAACKEELLVEEVLEQEQMPSEQVVGGKIKLSLNISDKASYDGAMASNSGAGASAEAGIATKAVKAGWQEGDKIHLFFTCRVNAIWGGIAAAYSKIIITYTAGQWVVGDEQDQESLDYIGKNALPDMEASIYAIYVEGDRTLTRIEEADQTVFSFGKAVHSDEIYGEIQEAPSSPFTIENNTLRASLQFSQVCTQVVVTNINASDIWRLESPLNEDIGFTHFRGIKELQVVGYNSKNLSFFDTNVAFGVPNDDGAAFYLADIRDASKPVMVFLTNTTNDREYYKLFPAERSFQLGKAYKLIGPELDASGNFINANGWKYHLANNKILYTKTSPAASLNIYGSFLDLFGANKQKLVYYTDADYGEMVFDANVTKIGEQSFYACTALATIILPQTVASIGDFAFDSCPNLTSITLPNGLTSIGYDAFYNCPSLKSINIPTSLTTIAKHTFQKCSSLESIDIPIGVTTIGDGAFLDCSSLQSVTLPNSITSVGESCFNGCSSLQSINIPNGVTTISNYTFGNCTALSNVTLPNSVISIGDGVFSYCTALSNVTLPNSIISIGDGVFYDCTSLNSITIPKNVTTIGEWAFYNCGLKTVYCKATTPPILGEESLDVYLPNKPTLYVPTESVSAYKASDWATYFSSINGMDFDD